MREALAILLGFTFAYVAQNIASTFGETEVSHFALLAGAVTFIAFKAIGKKDDGTR